ASFATATTFIESADLDRKSKIAAIADVANTSLRVASWAGALMEFIARHHQSRCFQIVFIKGWESDIGQRSQPLLPETTDGPEQTRLPWSPLCHRVFSWTKASVTTTAR